MKYYSVNLSIKRKPGDVYAPDYSFTVYAEDEAFPLDQCEYHDLELIQLIPLWGDDTNKRFVGLFSFTGISAGIGY